MAALLPIPAELLFLHGILKVVAAGIGAVLLGLVIRRYRQSKSKIGAGLIVTFTGEVLSTLFSSFDNLLGWDDLLGPGTWLGFGLSQLFLALVGASYFWIYLETFRVEELWTGRQKATFAAYTAALFTVSTFIMTYYTHGWPPDVVVPSLAQGALLMACFLSWIVGSTRLLKRLDDPRYVQRFKDLRLCSALLVVAMFSAMFSSMSDVESFFGWAAILIIIVALYFAYRGLLRA